MLINHQILHFLSSLSFHVLTNFIYGLHIESFYLPNLNYKCSADIFNANIKFYLPVA